MCVHTAPAVFALDATGKSSVVDPTGDSVEHILEAAEGCPMAAITVEDADTGERLFP
jgi:ferredoxin